MLLSSAWKPSSPLSSPDVLEPLRYPPLVTCYSHTANNHHDSSSAAAEPYCRTYSSDNGEDDKSTPPLSTSFELLSSRRTVSCEPPPIHHSSSALLSIAATSSSGLLSPLPQLSPAVTPPPTVPLRQATTPTTNDSNSSFTASLNQPAPRVDDVDERGEPAGRSSNGALLHSSLLLSRPPITSPFTLPRLDGERSGSPPRDIEQPQRPPPPLPHDLRLSSSSPSPMFSPSHALPYSSSLTRRRPMFGSYSGAHPLHRHALQSSWAPSRHMPLHILADSFSSLASYPPLYSTGDEQNGNSSSCQPLYPHSLYYHHADVQSDRQHAKEPGDDQRSTSRLRRAAREEKQQQRQLDSACENGAGNSSSFAMTELEQEAYSYDSMPLSSWSFSSNGQSATHEQQQQQQQHGQTGSGEHHQAVRKRSGPTQSGSSSIPPLPTSYTSFDSPTQAAGVTVLPFSSNGGSGDASTESDLSAPPDVRTKSKRSRVLKQEQLSPVPSVVLSTMPSPSSRGARRRHAAASDTVRAARVISALQVDTSAAAVTASNGRTVAPPSSHACAPVKRVAQKRKRARLLSATSASSQLPDLPNGHSPPTDTQSSFTPAAAFASQPSSSHPPARSPVPPAVPYDPSPTHNSLKAKRYFCDLCTKGFTQKGGLINHSRIHRDERPYQCRWPGCQRAFVQKCNLTRHERVHSGEKPYQCPVDGCGKAFNRKHGLAQHLTHHATGTYDSEQLLSAARPSGARDDNGRAEGDEEQGLQDCEDEEGGGEDQRGGGSGSDSSGDWWQSAARRVDVMAAAVRMQASGQDAGNTDSNSYNGADLPTPLFVSIPLFPVSHGQAMERKDVVQQPT